MTVDECCQSPNLTLEKFMQSALVGSTEVFTLQVIPEIKMEAQYHVVYIYLKTFCIILSMTKNNHQSKGLRTSNCVNV